MDCESNRKLPFLDLLVNRVNNTFTTNVYRKPTFTGFGLNFLSYTSFKFKTNAINTLIHRAYKLSSSYFAFHSEIEFLQRFLSINNVPRALVSKYII